MGVRDDQLHAAKAADLQRPQERGLERAVLAVAHVEAQDLALPVGRDPVATTTAWETTRWFTRALQ